MAFYVDLTIKQCQKAGFRKILLRGDTGFSCTEYLDRWDDESIRFVLGYGAHKKLTVIADSLGKSAWKPLDRKQRRSKTSRATRPNYKEQIVQANGYENKKLRAESYAELPYRPDNCDRDYRMIVVRKEIDVAVNFRSKIPSQERFGFH